MTTMLFLLLLNQGPSLDAMKRYENFRKSHPVLVGTFQEVSRGGALQCNVILEKTVRLRFDASAPGIKYTFICTPERAIEVNYIDKVYEEMPSETRIAIPKSRLTGSLGAFPMWILARNLSEPFPKGTTFMPNGQVTLDGKRCDRIKANIKAQGATGSVEAAIDDAGHVHDFSSDISTAEGRYTFHWRIPKMEGFVQSPRGAYYVNVPSGFVPYSLPETVGPLEAGNRFPLSGWRSGARDLNLKSRIAAKGALVAILGQDSEPSSRARASLMRLRSQMPVVSLTDARTFVSGTDGYDPTGRLLGQISVPATPLFALLDRNGKITHYWMGYDPAQATKFESDVKKAFAGKE